MALANVESAFKKLSLTVSQTALCIVPPEHLCEEINYLRSSYDQSYERWPPHISLLYPFVAVESLPQAASLIGAKLKALQGTSPPLDVHVRLEGASSFCPRKGNIIHLVPHEPNKGWSLRNLQDFVVEALGQQGTVAEQSFHLTIGQTKANDDQSRDSLVSKADLLSAIQWNVEELVVLVREKVTIQGQKITRMRVWGTIDLSGNVTPSESESLETGEFSDIISPPDTCTSLPMPTYEFCPGTQLWEPCPSTNDQGIETSLTPDALSISSYNVLLERLHPPPRERYPALIRSILSNFALADVLVLQEVCDDFLSHLLSQPQIRTSYPFATHGPPYQNGCRPLLMQRNNVALSRFKFSWENYSFEERYKNAIIMKLDIFNKLDENPGSSSLIVSGVHLTSGLHAARVHEKESQIRSLYRFLDQKYPNSPCIITGDLNIPTSTLTIKRALEENVLTPEKEMKLLQLEELLYESRFHDAWLVARASGKDTSATVPNYQVGEDLIEGELGGTFDPGRNPLAAALGGKDGRPQRYDRILVDGQKTLKIIEFNLFGFPDHPYPNCIEKEHPELVFGSDHWGVRARFEVSQKNSFDILRSTRNFTLPLAPARLSDTPSLLCLETCMTLPSNEDVTRREAVLELLRNVVINASPQQKQSDDQDYHEAEIAMILVPVGSYGMGVWSPSSDIDCLFIGPISSKTFFAIAEQRLRKAADKDIRILRKVKAATGTMLEIEVDGIKCDLQYCPAARVVERWPTISQLPQDDPTFDLSYQALSKLQAFRDLDSIQRSIPDMASFRTAHRYITAWAKHRGIYLARFGYLSGIHITLMLSRISKLLSFTKGRVRSADMICAFYHHYANFDWEGEMVFDPSSVFYNKPYYRRYPNEPMVILTIHKPIINVARAVTISSARTIVDELRRMNRHISNTTISWSEIIYGNEPTLDPSQEFLTAYSSFIKIHIQYWGSSLAKGNTLVAWLESRCIRLLNGEISNDIPQTTPADLFIDLNKNLPGIHARIWPARFTPTEMTDGTEYEGCYLIGLSKKEAKGIVGRKEEREHGVASLQRVLYQFKSKAQEETKYFDPTVAWLDVTHTRKEELGSLKVDGREWGTYALTEELSESEDEDEENVDFDSDASAKRSARKRSAPKVTSNMIGAKLRPAADILSRLRWDRNMDSSDYVVGYEDRFLGRLEILLDNWKTEQTDEEFIPQHRIMYFRRKSDGVVVWERESKKDLIFGSGVGRVE
ncbi:hypothetical protein LOZ36_006416 [Ophidiomyces ophidiicola]|nr:hypothetical protein LOZ36_006416 [Ophidiomyces ophidiicola]